MSPSKKSYYQIRSLQTKNLRNNEDVAARFIYLNRYCFNGLYRTNNQGKFNVPYGGGGTIPDKKVFLESASKLKKASLYPLSFEKTLHFARKGDFVYLDPPFSIENYRVFTQYDPSKFGMEELLTLKRWMNVLEKRKIKFLVSYLASKEATLLAKGLIYKKKLVRRNIAGFTSSRRMVKEVLISNY